MARTLERFPGRTDQVEEELTVWLDGRVHELVNGEDYREATTKLRNRLVRVGEKRGLYVRTKLSESGLIVQAYQPVHPDGR